MARLGTLIQVICIVAVAAVLAGASASASGVSLERPPATRVVAVQQLERNLLFLINQLRVDRGLVSLRRAPALARAAYAHARSMARLGFFAHVAPDGSTPRDRIARFSGTLASRSVGEVLLWRSPAPTASEALAMWLASPPHRQVLLAGDLRFIGLSAVATPHAPGAFRGLDVTIVAADLSG